MKYLPLAAPATALFLALAVPQTASAQMPTWSAEQTAAWSYVQQSWVDDVAQNGKWPSEYADPQLIAWSADHPAPRGRDAIVRWGRFENTQGRIIQYEVTPEAIAISGNTAVVAYSVFMVREDSKDKETHRVREGIVETLVRSGSGWKYLSTSSFSLGK